MKFNHCTWVFIFLMIILPTNRSHAGDTLITSADHVPSAVRQILKKHKAQEQSFSLYIKEIGAQKPWVILNSELPRNPASTIKIITALAGLALLGSGYTWDTHFYIDGKLDNESLHGNLLMSGEGDPFLVVEYFWHMLSILQAKGLKHIKGDLLVDNSAFVMESAKPGDFDNRPYRAYNVIPDATLVNFSAHKFHLIPQQQGLHIYTDPPTNTIKIINEIKLNKKTCNARNYNYDYRVNNHDNQYTVVTFFGKYPLACGSRVVSLSVQPNDQYIYGVFKSLWEAMGGTITGKVGKVKVNQKRPFHVAKSKPLSEVIVHMNKHSHNVMARQLFLTISKQAYNANQVQGSKALSRVTIEQWLSSINIDAPELFIDNGSGLSRTSKVSAKTLGMLLEYAYTSPYQPEFMASLPILGVDGTLRKRPNNIAPAGRIRVKTGSLKGVRAMAGYVHSVSNKRYVVVSLQNHSSVNHGRSKKIQDNILQWLYQQ